VATPETPTRDLVALETEHPLHQSPPDGLSVQGLIERCEVQLRALRLRQQFRLVRADEVSDQYRAISPTHGVTRSADT
jgi:hypothetical protein